MDFRFVLGSVRRGKKVRFSNPIFAQEVHVEDVEHELGPRGRLGSHRRSKESLRNRKISNRRKFRTAPGRLSGEGKGETPAKINWHLGWLCLLWDFS